MKNILLDTLVLIWWLSGDSRLGNLAQAFIRDPNNKIWVSAATIWEMSIKSELGKLTLPGDITNKVEGAGFTALAISFFHANLAGKLPPHHKDPFDRMLIAQAQVEGLQILTKDKQFYRYSVNLLNADD